MPKKQSTPISAPGSWIVLGMLVDRSPQSGYELASLSSRSIGHFWPITKAQIYQELPKLQAAGFIKGEDVHQDVYPDKTVYRATNAGVAAFMGWIEKMESGSPKLRHPYLLKVWFGANLTKQNLLAELEQFREELSQQNAYFKSLLKARQAKNDADIKDKEGAMRALAIRHGILRVQAELQWIQEVKSYLDNN